MILNLLRKLKRSVWRSLARWMQLSYRLPNGVEIRVDSYSDWCILGDLFMNGEYDPAIDYALRTLSNHKPFIFLDLGANVGFFNHRLLHRAAFYGTPANRFKGLW